MHPTNLQQRNMTLISPMKLTSSASDQNVFFTYVCLVNEVRPSASGNDNDVNSMDRQGRSLHVINSDEVSNKNESTYYFSTFYFFFLVGKNITFD